MRLANVLRLANARPARGRVLGRRRRARDGPRAGTRRVRRRPPSDVAAASERRGGAPRWLGGGGEVSARDVRRVAARSRRARARGRRALAPRPPVRREAPRRVLTPARRVPRRGARARREPVRPHPRRRLFRRRPGRSRSNDADADADADATPPPPPPPPPMRLPDVLRVARDVAAAMAYLSARRVVHRDLKSRNVLLLTEDDRPSAERARDRVGRTDRTDRRPRVARAKVCDFGIAKRFGAHVRRQEGGGGGGNTLAAAFGAIGREASAEVTLGAGAGTPAWMAPERFRGGNEAFRAEDREDRGRSGSSGSGSANKSSEGLGGGARAAAARGSRATRSASGWSFGRCSPGACPGGG